MTNKYQFNVDGMHCAACELLIEKKLSTVQGVKKVDAKLSENKVYIESRRDLNLKILNKLIENDGYTLNDHANPQTIKKKELLYGFGIAAIIMVLFFTLQYLGIVNWVTADEISLPFIFLIGIVASLSTCMAVVGGLVLSLSSTLSKQKKFKPLIAFHISRLVSFFVLGGIIGILGSTFTLTPTTTFIMNSILFVVMLILGINLLDTFPFFKKFQLRMPKAFGKGVVNNEAKGNLGAILLGAATFILPCGFTQSMQLYALSSQSFLNGALTMFVYSLGTLPVLALISFASVKFAKGLQSGLFYKSAGFVVILFAIFNFLTGLVAIGVLPPLFNI